MTLAKRKARQRRKLANRRNAITHKQRQHQRIRRWRFEDPALQRILRSMTNWQLSQWLRGGATKNPEHAVQFVLIQKKPKVSVDMYPDSAYNYILEKHS